MQQPYNGVRTPDRYYLGTRLPADLQSGSGFHWTGSGIAIQDAINEGRFLVLHRDHGDWDSWTHPSFDRWAVQALTNGDLLPFVYSVNCSCGFFDAETDLGWTMHESMMEAFLRTPRGGAVAGLGDNRVSPTWANSALARGFYDATWPRVLRDFGGDDSIRRLGDILNYGKTYLLTQVGVAQTTGREIGLFAALTELAIWHAFGDPTLEMWTRNPHRELMNAGYTLHSDDDGMEVGNGVEGATITAMHLAQRAIARGDSADAAEQLAALVALGGAPVGRLRPPRGGQGPPGTMEPGRGGLGRGGAARSRQCGSAPLLPKSRAAGRGDPLSSRGLARERIVGQPLQGGPRDSPEGASRDCPADRRQQGGCVQSFKKAWSRGHKVRRG